MQGRRVILFSPSRTSVLVLIVAAAIAVVTACSAQQSRLGEIIGTFARPAQAGIVRSGTRRFVPFRAKVEIVYHKETVRTIISSADGRFQARLPTGEYSVRGIVPRGYGNCSATPARIDVTPGATVHVRLLCASAIS